MRGMSFTPLQFSFATLVAIGLDKYEAYKITIKEKEYTKLKGDNVESFEEKCKKECKILLEQQNVIALVDLLRQEYERQVTENALNIDDISLSPKQLKNILGKLIVNGTKADNGNNNIELIKLVDNYMKNFAPSNEGDAEFARHFIQVYPKPFNGVCPFCNKEIDIPFGLSFTTTCCGGKMVWDEEKDRYVY